jgi:hypothetical protein
MIVVNHQRDRAGPTAAGQAVPQWRKIGNIIQRLVDALDCQTQRLPGRTLLGGE